LGDEAAISYSADSVLIRHRLIAREMVSLAPEVGIDIAEIVNRIVTAAVREADEYQASSNVLRIAYLSQEITDGELAVVAARSAVEAFLQSLVIPNQSKPGVSPSKASGGRRIDVLRFRPFAFYSR
jgi:hypothetical protein